MILYVNGDSHSAGAEAVNSYCFANDDPKYPLLGKIPHPDNLKESYGAVLASRLNAEFVCHAESGSSNERIIRTTKEYLKHNKPDLVIIGWATWERQEFLIDNTYYQFSAGRQFKEWPRVVEAKYADWVLTADPSEKALEWHNAIYDFHVELTNLNINHLFFNTLHTFKHSQIDQLSWSNRFIDPYSEASSYFNWLIDQGYNTVAQGNYHFSASAHRAWAEYLLTYIKKESIITT